MSAPTRPRISTAPLLDVSDRHARYFWRLLSKQALLYTEMINMGAIVRGAAQSHLRYNPEEHPVALQLGGSDPAMLAQSARMGEQGAMTKSTSTAAARATACSVALLVLA